MQSDWKEDQPIYRQLQAKVVSFILNGTYPEGSALPSVRQVSADLSINHLTVAKAYQELVDEGLLEKRRGLGMFVVDGAKAKVLELEKKKFLNAELPELLARIAQLNISKEDLMEIITNAEAGVK